MRASSDKKMIRVVALSELAETYEGGRVVASARRVTVSERFAEPKSTPINEKMRAQKGSADSGLDMNKLSLDVRSAAAAAAAASGGGGSLQTSGSGGSDLGAPVDGGVEVATKAAAGRSGSTIKLRGNLREMSLRAETLVYRYDVDIEAAVDQGAPYRHPSHGGTDDYERQVKRGVCWSVYCRAVEQHPTVLVEPFSQVYDRSKTLFTLAKIPLKDYEVVLRGIEVDGCRYHMTISEPTVGGLSMTMDDLHWAFDSDLELRDRVHQQYLELATSQQLYHAGELVAYGRNFFRKMAPEQYKDLGAGRFLVEGFTKGVRIVEGTDPSKKAVAAMQIDIKKSAVFREQSALQTLRDVVRPAERDLRMGLNSRQREAAHKLFKELKVVTLHKPKSTTFNVWAVSRQHAADIDMDWQTGGVRTRISIADYFARTYTQLKYPNLPCFVRRRPGRPGEAKCVEEYYPVEVCGVLPYQRVSVPKQTEEQQRRMILESAVPPARRLQEIAREELSAQLVSNSFLAALGMSISPELAKLEGRVLQSVRMQYAQQKHGSTVEADKYGNWDMRANSFFVPASVPTYAVISLAPMQGNTLCDFKRQFEQLARQKGVRLGECCYEGFVGEGEEFVSAEQFFDAARVGPAFSFVLIIVAAKHDPLKNAIKFAEVKTDIVTQMVLAQTVKMVAAGGGKKADQTLLNIVAKTNMKMGGLNYAVDSHKTLLNKWFADDVMFVGIDVNHPPPLTREQQRQNYVSAEPSVIGIVATTANHKMKMTMDYYFQDARLEDARAINQLLMEMLRRYAKSHAGRMPARLIVYRDGVSEGQFKMVLSVELALMEEACRDVGGGDYAPLITEIICCKRHNTRLFRAQQLIAAAKPIEQNVPAGTVVDSVLVHPTEWEFYLCAHSSPQGTSKPVKYTVLRDDNGFTSDELQNLTFVLCHGHEIISKAVSLPAPVYAAHNAAMRGKRIWKAALDEEHQDGMSCDGESIESADSVASGKWIDISARLRASHRLTDKAYWA